MPETRPGWPARPNAAGRWQRHNGKAAWRGRSLAARQRRRTRNRRNSADPDSLRRICWLVPNPVLRGPRPRRCSRWRSTRFGIAADRVRRRWPRRFRDHSPPSARNRRGRRLLNRREVRVSPSSNSVSEQHSRAERRSARSARGVGAERTRLAKPTRFRSCLPTAYHNRDGFAAKRISRSTLRGRLRSTIQNAGSLLPAERSRRGLRCCRQQGGGRSLASSSRWL